MRKRFYVPFLCCFVALLVFALGATVARADSVSLSNGGSVSGGPVYELTGFGQGITVVENVPWTISSTDGNQVTNTNVESQGAGPHQSLSGAPYVVLAVSTDSTFIDPLNFTEVHFDFAIAGTVFQLEAELRSLPVGQTLQIPLLTTVADGCANLGTCSDEFINTVVNGQHDFALSPVFNIVGPAFLDFTNDPGLYQATLTSTPLQPPTSTAPEPSALVLLITGLAGVHLFRRLRKRCQPES